MVLFDYLSKSKLTKYQVKLGLNKFLGCIETAYQCTASVENILRSEYQDEINHIISSFKCTN